MEKEKVKNIELFAGAGGLSLGLEKAGFDVVELVEFDHNACETLKKNRPKWNIIEDDIHNVDFEQYKGKIDVVTGGAPCQAFSYAGKRKGFGDVRGTLFEEYARCVSQVQPKMFLFENVKGLLSHDDGRTFKTIFATLEELGYVLTFEVLNACYGFTNFLAFFASNKDFHLFKTSCLVVDSKAIAGV